MNVTLPAAYLKRLVKQLFSVASTATSIMGNGLAVSDGDMGLVIDSPLKSNEPFAVNSRMFNSICSKLTKETSVSMGEGLVIKSGSFKAVIPFVKDNQPPSPVSPLTDGFTVSGKLLNELLGYASSVTTDGVRFDHTGSVLLQTTIPGGMGVGEPSTALEAVATDNLRVAFTRWSLLCQAALKWLIPSKIVRAIKDIESDITITESESVIFLKTNDLTIWTKKLTKPFPDITRVIPKSYKLVVEIKIDELSEALQRLSPLVDPAKPLVVFDFKGDKLGLSVNGLEGKSEDELSVTPVTPDLFDEPYPVKLGVNEIFLKKHLTSLKFCDKLVLKANQSGTPFMIEAGEKKILMAGMKI